MKVKFGANTYEISDSCNLDRRGKRSWKRALDEHGPEGVLASQKYREFASCMLDELESLGVEIVADTSAELPKKLEAKLDEVIEDPTKDSGESPVA